MRGRRKDVDLSKYLANLMNNLANTGEIIVGVDTESNYDSKVYLLQVAVFSDTRKEVYLLNMGELAEKPKCMKNRLL